MAKRKRPVKRKSRSPAKRRVSRVKKPAKRKSTRVKRKSRPTRKNGGNARAISRHAPRNKAHATASRKPKAVVRKASKRLARRTPRFSDAARRSGETRQQYTRRLEYLLRTERELTSELTRTPTQRARNQRFVDIGVAGESQDIPAGFQPVGSGTGRGLEDINDLLAGMDDIDWEHFDVDWDDIYDDVGDEDSDMYGEMA